MKDFLHYSWFIEQHKLFVIDLRKQWVFDADGKIIQQITFTVDLDADTASK